MATLLLVIIYAAFISLGLPDSLLGAAWPAMYEELHQPLQSAGVISIIVACCNVLSSLGSGFAVKKLGSGLITFVSCLLTCGALVGFSFAPSILWLIVFAVPLGLGGGMVDAVLNNYVAEHYAARHMSWLHSFWGVGVTGGSFIMAQFIVSTSWRDGYATVAIIQAALVTILLLSLPLWSKVEKIVSEHESAANKFTNNSALAGDQMDRPWKVRGVWLAMLSFVLYCGIEMTIGLWGSSYLVKMKAFTKDAGAQLVAMYFGGITIGRLLSGFITYRFSNRQMIVGGQLIVVLGIILLLLPLPTSLIYVEFMLIGLGLAPIFPSMIHETPVRFGQKHSQSIIGYQTASAALGVVVVPPLFGWVAAQFSLAIFTLYIGLLAVALLAVSERLVALVKRVDRQKLAE